MANFCQTIEYLKTTIFLQSQKHLMSDNFKNLFQKLSTKLKRKVTKLERKKLENPSFLDKCPFRLKRFRSNVRLENVPQFNKTKPSTRFFIPVFHANLFSSPSETSFNFYTNLFRRFPHHLHQ